MITFLVLYRVNSLKKRHINDIIYYIVDNNRDDIMVEKKYRYVFRKESILILLGIFIGLMTLIGVSYALIIYYTNDDERVNSVIAGNLKIVFNEGNTLNVSNAYSMSIIEGMNTPVYSFNIANTGTVNARYIVRLVEDNSINLVDNKYMMISYQKEDNEYTIPKKISDLGEKLIIDDEGFLGVNKDINYNIKIWLDSSAPNSEMGKVYKVKVVVEAVNTVTTSIDDKERPVIKLKGSNVINLKIGEEFNDPGIESITDNVDKLDIDKVTKTYEYYDGKNLYIVDKVDTKKSGVYYIYYEVFDNNLNHNIETRVVNVNKENNYYIKLLGDSVIKTNSLSNYDDLGAQVYDINNNFIDSNITTINGFNTNNKSDIYFIKYIYKDNDNIYSNIRKVESVKAYTLYAAITKNDISKYYGSLEENDNKIYVTGINPNNYLMYSNILFRIVSIDKNNRNVTIITEEGLTSLLPNNDVYDYLNNNFLNTLVNINYLVKNSDNNYVGLLTKEDYNMTYKAILPNTGYLVKDKDWLILDEDISVVNSRGEIKKISLNQEKLIRPVINLKGEVIVTGNGTIKNPYIIK